MLWAAFYTSQGLTWAPCAVLSPRTQSLEHCPSLCQVSPCCRGGFPAPPLSASLHHQAMRHFPLFSREPGTSACPKGRKQLLKTFLRVSFASVIQTHTLLPQCYPLCTTGLGFSFAAEVNWGDKPRGAGKEQINLDQSRVKIAGSEGRPGCVPGYCELLSQREPQPPCLHIPKQQPHTSARLLSQAKSNIQRSPRIKGSHHSPRECEHIPDMCLQAWRMVWPRSSDFSLLGWDSGSLSPCHVPARATGLAIPFKPV